MILIEYKQFTINTVIFLTAFVMLIDYHPTKFFALILFIMWAFYQDKKSNLLIIKDKIAQSFILLFSLFVVALFWTEDMRNGIKILERESLLLFSPLLIALLDRKYLKYIMLSIFFVIFISQLIYILEYHKIVDLYYKTKDIYHYPFIHRMYFTTILAFSIGYGILKIDFKKYKTKENLALLIFIVLSIYTLFIMGGRSGYINFVVVISIILIYKFKIKNKLNIVLLLFSLLVVSLMFYKLNISETFNAKVDKTVTSISAFDIKNQAEQEDTSKRTSLSCRLEFWYHSSKIIKENPIFGVGTGDGVVAIKELLGDDGYKKLKKDCGLNVRRHFNTHNLYINIVLMFGFFGLGVLLYFFYLQLSTAKKYKSVNMMILIIPTIITMFSQSALFTSHYFISFYSFVLSIIYLEERDKIENKK